MSHDKKEWVHDNFSFLGVDETSTGRQCGVCYCGKSPDRCSLDTKRITKGILYNCKAVNCPLGGGCTRATGFHNLHLGTDTEDSKVQGRLKVAMCNKPITLPDSYVRSVPKDGTEWLSKYYIGGEEIRKFDIGYDTRTGRIVFPIYQEGTLIAHTDRRDPTSTEGLKWLHSKGGTGSLIYEATSRTTEHESELHVEATRGVTRQEGQAKRKRYAVLVEDPLSAIRCSIAGYNSVAILGTSINANKMKRIKKWWGGLVEEDFVAVVLDADTWRHSKQIKLAQQLSRAGIPVSVVHTDEDPKALDTKTLQEMIG